jgi:predicted ribosome quality control (RQC) complex YloA/Tae2 family protein
MLTDWLLIRRLARELEARLKGGRIQDVGLLGDGRTALVFRRSGERHVLAIDLFSSPPLVTEEDGELGILEEPGFVRTLARSLKNMTLTGVVSRRFDRLVRLRFSVRSRFGVGDELDLYLELVPRFGNIVLVKGESVVAARKEFTPAENPRRATVAGSPYVLPPLPARPVQIAPPPMSDSDESDIADEPLHVYRRDGRLVQAYIAPLDEFHDAEHTRVPSILDVFAELRTQAASRAGNERGQRRRQALIKRLDERDRKLHRELQLLSNKRQAADRREDLRAQGEEIFATLYSLDDSEREPAKERAGVLFAEYKKLRNSLPHIDDRARAVRNALQIVETLHWEAERAGDEDLDDVDAAVEELERRPRAVARPAPRKRKRRMLELRTSSGSRILVGRSPVENAELTFQLARPDDLWFHARGVPGAHVILSRDDRGRAPDEDVQAAASLAAFYSKAQAATAAVVDYTLRKHVRKQRAAPPGLVWYTHAKTIVAQPQSLESLPTPEKDTAP